MKTYIALLRGINVGGKTSLPMKELVAILEELGCQNIKTYIQSGNVVLESDEDDISRLSESITTEIHKRRGFSPRVILLKLLELKKAIENNPFPEGEENPKALHVGFLTTTPKKPDLESLERLKTNTERFQLIGKIFYLYAPDGVGRSKLAANSEKSLGVSMTDRNWRTVRKILEMTQESRK
jgi:uncharacterized protein (DUF1697 family)